MEIATMGKVLVTDQIENLNDLFGVRKGLLSEDQVRCVEVTDALVDSGATGLLLPSRMIAQLDDRFASSPPVSPLAQQGLTVTEALPGLAKDLRNGHLGIKPLHVRPSRTIAGPVPLQMYRAVRLTVQGRDCISDVREIPDDFSIVIGQVPLELMNWVVDLKGQRLIGNPEHGGQHMIEV